MKHKSSINREFWGYPGLERSSREGNSYPLQYSCLENSMDRGAWKAIVHGVAKSRTWLGDSHTPHFRDHSDIFSYFLHLDKHCPIFHALLSMDESQQELRYGFFLPSRVIFFSEDQILDFSREVYLVVLTRWSNAKGQQRRNTSMRENVWYGKLLKNSEQV